jgi:predicted transposase/invertase (TIGR01784 family)
MEDKITTRLNPLNDFAFKKILGEKGDEPQLIAFLNAVLHRTGKDTITDLEIVENKDIPADTPDGKSAKLDVRAKLQNGTRVNIEVQLQNKHDMAERSLRYWSLEYIGGLVKGQDYAEQPQVIVINIVDFDYIKLDEFHTSFHLYEDFHKDYMLTGALEIHYIDMVKFRKLDIADLNNPIHRWLVFFNEQSPVKLLEEAIKMDTAIRTTAERMEMIRRDPALAHAYDLYEEEHIARLMWAQGERREGEAVGVEKGIKIGKQEGRQEGEYNKAVAIARWLKSQNMPLAQIAEGTGLSPDDIAKL